MTIDLLSAGGLTAVVSLLLALLFILLPPLRTFTALDADTQQAVMGAGIIAIAVVAVGLGCAGFITFIACTASSIGEYALTVVVSAIVGDRVSKSAFAAARWWDARTDARAGLRSIFAGAGGKLLY